MIELTFFSLQLVVVNVHQPQQHNICKNVEVYQKISHHLTISTAYMYAKSIKKKQSEAHHWSCYCSHEVTPLKTSQPVTWCSFRSLPPPIMWIQRPSRSQSCLSQSGYNNLWQCIYLSVCDKWYLIFQLYANVWSQGYSFLTVHLYFEALQSSSFAWSCMKRHALKNWGRDMMHLQYITFVIHIDDYRCIQLGSSCWPLALNNLGASAI